MSDESSSIKLSRQVYGREAVLRASYKFTDRFTVEVEPIGDAHWGVRFAPKDGSTSADAAQAVADYSNVVLDQQLQIQLDDRFGDLRDTIFDFAFKPLEGDRAKKNSLSRWRIHPPPFHFSPLP